MAKDRGWDYLNSSGDDFDFDKDNDGSWGYENEDGSGSFYGNDGSWGYKNSDGSASYYGVDGSWGYKNSDGSISYYGNDGSWGYKNSDGSGSYYGSDNDSEFYSSDDDYSGGSSGENLLGVAIGLGIVGIVGIVAALAGRNSDSSYSVDDDDDDESYYDSEAYRKLREEQARQRAREAEERRLKSEERKAKRKKFWGTITRKKVSPSLTAIQCCGMRHEDVVNAFKGQEFYNITTVKSEDLTIDRIDEEGLVDIVRIDGSSDFDITSVYYFGAKIEVVYHTLMRATLPFTSRNAKKRNVDDVVQALFNEGFVSVEKLPIADLTTGWIKKDGSVESISVDGRTDYKKGDKYRLDSHITVSYHTFKMKS